MTEMNKDEALRCIEIAVQSMAASKLDKAEKFLLKAEKLYPTSTAKDLLNKLRRTQTNANSSSNGANHANSGSGSSTGGNSENLRKRNNSGARTSESDYSHDQLEAVRKVKKCKNYYEILGVTKTATDSEIKKSYKKLALQLHPDKNRAPGAVEAFKAVGNAAAVLTDPEKRKQYDLFGQEGNISAHGGNNGGNSRSGYYTSEFGYTRGFQADVSAEELFNMFFGGGFPQQNVYMRTQRRRQQREERENQSSSSALINLLPIVLLICVSMMSSLFISDPVYNLNPTHKYSVRRVTNNLKIPYYVKDNFHTEYQGSVRRLEESVEEDFHNHLKHACSRERNYRESMLSKARSFHDEDLHRKAQKLGTPSCENLYRIFS